LLQSGTATVKLLHFRNASTHVLSYTGSNITIQNVILTQTTGSTGVGIELNQGNSYTVRNTTIESLGPGAAAIEVPFGGTPDIQNNLVTNNTRGLSAGSFAGTYAYNDVFGSLDFNW